MIELSIIIPVYQAERYIGECLESLLCQKLCNYEIICIDDGSFDRSAEIIEEYARRHPLIKYYYQNNQGVSSARNHGLQRAKGKYILYIDADDVIKKQSLGKALKKIKRSQAEILVFGGQAKAFFTTPEWVKDAFFTRNTVYEHNSIQALFHESGARPSVCNKLFLWDIVKEAYFPNQIIISEDLAFLFDVFPKAEKIVFCSQNIYRYRILNEKSAMHCIEKNVGILFENHLQTVEYVLRLWRKRGILESEKTELRKWAVDFLGYIYILLSDTEKKEVILRLEKISECLNFSEQDKRRFYQPDLPKQRLIKKLGKSLCYQFQRYGLKFGIYSTILKVYGRVRDDRR